MGRKVYTAQQFITAIQGSGGIISTIARRVGCNWWTAKKYIEKYPTVREAYEAECEAVSDMAVSQVLTAIKEGDLPTAKWWLSKKRRREFGDNLDITTDGNPIVVVGLGINTDEL